MKAGLFCASLTCPQEPQSRRLLAGKMCQWSFHLMQTRLPKITSELYVWVCECEGCCSAYWKSEQGFGRGYDQGLSKVTKQLSSAVFVAHD